MVNDVNRHKETPLHQAAMKGATPALDFLVQHGAEVNLQNDFGESALHYAVRLGSVKCIETLLAADADVFLEGTEEGSPITLAEVTGQGDILALMKKSTSYTRHIKKYGDGTLRTQQQKYNKSYQKMKGQTGEGTPAAETSTAKKLTNVAFGIPRGKCQDDGCDCHLYQTEMGKGGQCQNCGHFPVKHVNLSNDNNAEQPSAVAERKANQDELARLDSSMSKSVFSGSDFQHSWTIDSAELKFDAILGEGTAAKVYKGKYRGQEVAIKVLKESLDPTQMADFVKEFQIYSDLRSPHVVLFFGACAKPELCMVFEYCLAEKDHEILTNEGFMNLEELVAAHNDATRESPLLIAAYDHDSQRIVYERAEKVIVNAYVEDQDMVMFQSASEASRWETEIGEDSESAEGNFVSLMVTPEHDMFAKRGFVKPSRNIVFRQEMVNGKLTTADYAKVRAGELVTPDNERACVKLLAVAREGLGTGGSIPQHVVQRLSVESIEKQEAFLELLGYWMMAGDIGSQGQVLFAANKAKAWLEERMKRVMGVDGSVDWKRREKVFEVNVDAWCDWFHQEVEQEHRCFPSWTLNLDKQRVRFIFSGVKRGYGMADSASGVHCVWTSSSRLRDQLEILALHAGYAARFYRSKREVEEEEVEERKKICIDGWQFEYTETKQFSEPNLRQSSNDMTRTKYSGRTWCVRVPHGLIVARRAQRNEDGVVTKASLPLIVGNCNKGSLFDVLNGDDELDWFRVLKISVDISKSLNTLHSWVPPIVHRDMKSLNLLVDGNWTIKVSDFGLSRFTSGAASNLSTLGKLRGTYAYSAPEVYFGDPFTTKADVFSIGVIFWEMAVRSLTGEYQMPYSEFPELVFDFQIIIQVAKNGKRPTIPENCPSDYKQLIEDCWSQDKEKRPEIPEVLARLEKMLEKEGEKK